MPSELVTDDNTQPFTLHAKVEEQWFDKRLSQHLAVDDDRKRSPGAEKASFMQVQGGRI